MSIEELDPRNTADVNAVADLHLAHLPDSPIISLGQPFVRRFYYTRLVREGLIGCLLCRADDRVVGFISFTKYPYQFMSQGIRRGWPQLAWHMFRGFLARPAMVKDLFHAIRMMRQRRSESKSDHMAGMGEVISIVSLPEYQKHVPAGGKGRLTSRLFEEMIRYFRDANYDRVRLYVKPENRASNLFCAALGCDFEKVLHAGIVTHQYTYHLNGRPDAEHAPPAPA